MIIHVEYLDTIIGHSFIMVTERIRTETEEEKFNFFVVFREPDGMNWKRLGSGTKLDKKDNEIILDLYVTDLETKLKDKKDKKDKEKEKEI